MIILQVVFGERIEGRRRAVKQAALPNTVLIDTYKYLLVLKSARKARIYAGFRRFTGDKMSLFGGQNVAIRGTNYR